MRRPAKGNALSTCKAMVVMGLVNITDQLTNQPHSAGWLLSGDRGQTPLSVFYSPLEVKMHLK